MKHASAVPVPGAPTEAPQPVPVTGEPSFGKLFGVMLLVAVTILGPGGFLIVTRVMPWMDSRTDAVREDIRGASNEVAALKADLHPALTASSELQEQALKRITEALAKGATREQMAQVIKELGLLRESNVALVKAVDANPDVTVQKIWTIGNAGPKATSTGPEKETNPPGAVLFSPTPASQTGKAVVKAVTSQKVPKLQAWPPPELKGYKLDDAHADMYPKSDAVMPNGNHVWYWPKVDIFGEELVYAKLRDVSRCRFKLLPDRYEKLRVWVSDGNVCWEYGNGVQPTDENGNEIVIDRVAFLLVGKGPFSFPIGSKPLQ